MVSITLYYVFQVIFYGFGLYLHVKEYQHMQQTSLVLENLSQKEKELNTSLARCNKLLNETESILKSLRS